MDDAVAMRGVERGRDLDRVLDRLVGRQRALWLIDPRASGPRGTA